LPSRWIGVLPLVLTALPVSGDDGPSTRPIPSEVVAYVQRTGDRAQVPEVVQSLASRLRKRSLPPKGPPTVIFYSDPGSTPPDMLFWEVRIPIGDIPPRQPGDDLPVLRSEAIARAACILRVARPGEPGPEVRTLRAWMKDQGLQVNGPWMEVHRDLPLDGAGPMELCFPVIPR
jgi:hypothetical protein